MSNQNTQVLDNVVGALQSLESVLALEVGEIQFALASISNEIDNLKDKDVDVAELNTELAKLRSGVSAIIAAAVSVAAVAPAAPTIPAVPSPTPTVDPVQQLPLYVFDNEEVPEGYSVVDEVVGVGGAALYPFDEDVVGTEGPVATGSVSNVYSGPLTAA